RWWYDQEQAAEHRDHRDHLLAQTSHVVLLTPSAAVSTLRPVAGRPVAVAPPGDRTQAGRGREIPLRAIRCQAVGIADASDPRRNGRALRLDTGPSASPCSAHLTRSEPPAT